MDKKLPSKNIGQKIEEERAFMHEGCFRNPEACFCLLVLCLDFDRTPCAWQLIKKKKSAWICLTGMILDLQVPNLNLIWNGSII
jgi:hypothetical protein